MTLTERNILFESSVSVRPGDPTARRFEMRRTRTGLELFDIKFTRFVKDEPEFHGHPASRVPRSILKMWKDRGEITEVEYGRLVKELPGC